MAKASKKATEKADDKNAMVTIRNVANLKTTEVLKEVWDRNKHKWKGTFEIVAPVKVPPEVKELEKTKAEASTEKTELPVDNQTE